MTNQLYVNENDLVFDNRLFKTMLRDIYNDPCRVSELSMSEVEELMELTDYSIKLKKDIVIIYYYNEIRLIGFNKSRHRFEIFNLPEMVQWVLRHIHWFIFYESNIIGLLNSEYEEIDYYFSAEGYTFDNNDHKMYYIFP